MRAERTESRHKTVISVLILLVAQLSGLSFAPSAVAGVNPLPKCSTKLTADEQSALKKEIDARLSFGARRAKQTAFEKPPVEIQVGIGGLRENRKDVVAYINDGSYCGSGGCTLLILADEHASSSSSPRYRYVSGFITAKPPIVALKKSHHGWRDIGVFVSGGGITEGYMATLEFDGKRYPGNPTLPSRHKNPTADVDSVLIGRADGSAGQCILSM